MSVKMKIRETASNDLNFDIWCQAHNSQQHLKDFSRQLNTLDNIENFCNKRDSNTVNAKVTLFFSLLIII